MGRITADQSQQLTATLAANVNWEEIDFEELGLQDAVIRKPKEAGAQFTAFLKNRCRTQVVIGVFPVWKTIKLGTGLKTADEFREALKSNGFRIGSWGNNILSKPAFKAATEETEVDLVNVSVAELGFKDGATRKDIYERAIDLGLQLCPNEVGPQLRLQYKDQPKGEWLRIAMEPITDSSGRLLVFNVVRNDGGLWLDGDDGHPDYFWYGNDRWVFARRK